MEVPPTTVTFHHGAFAAALNASALPWAVASSRVFFSSLLIRPAGYLDGSCTRCTPAVSVYLPMIMGSGMVAEPVDVGFAAHRPVAVENVPVGTSLLTRLRGSLVNLFAASLCHPH